MAYTGMSRPNWGAQTSGGGVPNTKLPGQPSPWGPVQTAGPGNGPVPNPGMPPKPIPGPNGTDNPAGGPNGLKPIGGLSDPLQPFTGAGNTAPGNAFYGSTGIRSSGAPSSGVQSTAGIPMVNTQTTHTPDAAWQAGKAQWDAQTAAGMTPADRAKAAGDPDWAKYGPTSGTTSTTSAQAPGNPYAQFSSQNNLIGSQITPTTDPRLATAEGYTSNAAGNLAGYTQPAFKGVSPYDATGALSQLATGNSQMQGMGTAGYRPVAGTDMSGAQGYLSLAAGASMPSAASAGAGQMGGFGFSGDTQGLRSTTMGQLDKTLNNTPDRGTLASDAYNLLLERSAPQQQQEDRALAQRTAAMGRRGSGMYNSEQMDLATARERERDMARRDLANNAAGLSLQDQMDKLNASRGVTSDFSGYDLGAGKLNLGYQNSNNAERGNAFNREMAVGDTTFNRNRALSSDSLNMAQIGRNDALTERGAMNEAERYGNDLTMAKADSSRQYGIDQYGIGRDGYSDSVNERDSAQAYDQQGFNNRRSSLGDLSGYEDMLRQNGRMDRDEVRGERGYQAGMDQQAIDNNVRQRGLEDQYRNSDIGYGRDLAGMGYSQDPYGALANAGDQYGRQASDAYGAAGDLFSNWAQTRALGGNPRTAPRPVYAQ